MKTVTFLSALFASQYGENAHVISIGSEGSWYKIPESAISFVRITFDDVVGDVEGLTPFHHRQADTIIEFVESCGDDPIMVHCEAGVSRSAAVAQFISDHFGHALDLGRPCIGTTSHMNRRVYETLKMMSGVETMSQYYGKLERRIG